MGAIPSRLRQVTVRKPFQASGLAGQRKPNPGEVLRLSALEDRIAAAKAEIRAAKGAGDWSSEGQARARLSSDELAYAALLHDSTVVDSVASADLVTLQVPQVEFPELETDRPGQTAREQAMVEEVQRQLTAALLARC